MFGIVRATIIFAPTKLKMKKSISNILLIFLLITVYAVVRYHIFGGVPVRDFLFYTLNKIVIFSAILLLLLYRLRAQKKLSNLYVQVAFALIALHILLSILLLQPVYYKDFFMATGKYSLLGSLSLLGGSMAAVLFLFKDKFSLSRKWRALLFSFFISIHLLAMGLQGWMHPATWHGYMPPITLLAFILLWFGLVWDVYTKNKYILVQ